MQAMNLGWSSRTLLSVQHYQQLSAKFGRATAFGSKSTRSKVIGTRLPAY